MDTPCVLLYIYRVYDWYLGDISSVYMEVNIRVVMYR